jgi:hypothetical protein
MRHQQRGRHCAQTIAVLLRRIVQKFLIDGRHILVSHAVAEDRAAAVAVVASCHGWLVHAIGPSLRVGPGGGSEWR